LPYLCNSIVPARCLAAVIIFFILLLASARLPQVATSSEAREIQVAREILIQQEWILPSRNGVVPSKPPLFHWIVAGIGTLKGEVSVALARAVSTSAAALSVLLAVWIAGQISRSLGRAAPVACWWACVVATLTYGAVMQAGLAMVDSVFALTVAAAIASIVVGMCRQSSVGIQPREFTLFYLACGLGVLAKGPLGLVLPLIIAVPLTILSIGWRAALRIWLIPRLGWILVVALALSWYLLAAREGGEEFITRQIFFENLDRFTGGERVNSKAPWFYFPSLLRSAAPWSWLLIPVVWHHLRQQRDESAWRKTDPETRRRSGLEWAGAVWLGSGILLLSIASGKRHSYLLPLFPGLAIYLGVRGPVWWQSLPHRITSGVRYVVNFIDRRSIWILIFIMLCIEFLRQLPQLATKLSIDLSPQLIAASTFFDRAAVIAAAVLGLLAIVIFFSRNRFDAAWRGWLLASMFLIFAVFMGNGVKAEIKDFGAVAEQVRNKLPQAAKLTVVREKLSEEFDVLLMYLQLPARFIDLDSISQNDLCAEQFVLTSNTIYTQQLRIGDSSFRAMTPTLQVADGQEGLVILSCSGG